MFLLLFSEAQDPTQIKASSGTVRGYSPYPSIRAYLGIPYAQRPIGNLRFAPEPITAPASDTIDGTSFGSSCYQFNLKALVPE
jgi:carboxylesterase type B